MIKACILILFIFLAGCYSPDGSLSSSREDLTVELAGLEAELGGLTERVDQAIIFRNDAAESAKNAVGWLAKDTTGSKLIGAANDVEFAILRKTQTSKRIAQIKAKLALVD